MWVEPLRCLRCWRTASKENGPIGPYIRKHPRCMTKEEQEKVRRLEAESARTDRERERGY